MIIRASVLILSLISGEMTAEATGSAAPAGHAELALAAGVASWASQNSDADAMMVAGDLVLAHARGGLADAEGDDEVDAVTLFDQAAALATDGASLSRLEQRLSVDPRGIARALGTAGPIGRLMLIEPGRPLSFALTARGSEQALLHVGPTAGGDLHVSVADERGIPVCANRAPGTPVLCSWRPAFTTTYRVRIRVLSAVPVTTVITSN